MQRPSQLQMNSSFLKIYHSALTNEPSSLLCNLAFLESREKKEWTLHQQWQFQYRIVPSILITALRNLSPCLQLILHSIGKVIRTDSVILKLKWSTKINNTRLFHSFRPSTGTWQPYAQLEICHQLISFNKIIRNRIHFSFFW